MADAFDAVFDAAVSPSSGADPETTPSGDAETVEIDVAPAAEVAPATGDPVVQDDEPGDVEVVDEEPAAELDAAAEGEPPAKPAPKVDPNLPEGVAVEKGVDGKKRWVLDPARGAVFHASYKQVQAIKEKLGIEAIDDTRLDLLVNDHKAFEDMDNWMAGAAGDQEKVFRFWLGRGPKAYEQGVVNYHPHDHTANAFLAAAEKSAPKVYQAIESRFVDKARNDVVEQAYAKATQLVHQLGADHRLAKNALGTAQNLEALLFNGKFRKPEDLLKPSPAADPLAARSADLDKRETALRQRDEAAASERWNGWLEEVRGDRAETRQELIAEALKPFAKTLKTYPEMQKTLEIRLEHEIVEAFNKDRQNWDRKVGGLFQRAKTAGTEQFRGGVREQLKREYAAVARKVVNQIGAKIISDTTQAVVGGSQDTHKRLQTGQNQRAGVAAGGPAKTPIVAKAGNGKIPIDKIDAMIDSYFVNS